MCDSAHHRNKESSCRIAYLAPVSSIAGSYWPLGMQSWEILAENGTCFCQGSVDVKKSLLPELSLIHAPRVYATDAIREIQLLALPCCRLREVSNVYDMGFSELLGASYVTAIALPQLTHPYGIPKGWVPKPQGSCWKYSPYQIFHGGVEAQHSSMCELFVSCVPNFRTDPPHTSQPQHAVWARLAGRWLQRARPELALLGPAQSPCSSCSEVAAMWTAECLHNPDAP